MSAGLWAGLGLVLLIVEVTSGTFVVMFFGVSALLLAAYKLFQPANYALYEITAWIALGVLLALGLRKIILQKWGSGRQMEIDQDQIITVTQDIASHGEAQISYQGTVWTAYNDSEKKISSGDKVKVLRTEGIRLIIKGL